MSLPSRKPVNYLNNKDILKEIHESKTTYCYFSKPEYHRYDFIVDMPQDTMEHSLDYAFKPETIQKNVKEFQDNVQKFYSVFTNGVAKN